MKEISGNRHRIGGLQGDLEPAHIFVAAPLPEDWQIPPKFWQFLRAVLCWQIWKARNEFYMADRQIDHRRTIRKTWHQMGMYLRKEWRMLARKIRNGRLSFSEATSVMQIQFGSNVEIWNLHGMVLQIPPVPHVHLAATP